jgi:hypothetical protein
MSYYKDKHDKYDDCCYKKYNKCDKYDGHKKDDSYKKSSKYDDHKKQDSYKKSSKYDDHKKYDSYDSHKKYDSYDKCRKDKEKFICKCKKKDSCYHDDILICKCFKKKYDY